MQGDAELYTRENNYTLQHFQHYFEKNLDIHRRIMQWNYQKAYWFLFCNFPC